MRYAIVLLVMLSGCATTEPRADQDKKQVAQTAQEKTVWDFLGFVINTLTVVHP